MQMPYSRPRRHTPGAGGCGTTSAAVLHLLFGSALIVSASGGDGHDAAASRLPPTPPHDPMPSDDEDSGGHRLAAALAHGTNHNPTFQRNRATNCQNNDIVVREDEDGLPCIFLQEWATAVANAEAAQGLSWQYDLLTDTGNFPGMFEAGPCIDIQAGATPACCDLSAVMCPAMACGTGNLYAKIREHHFGQATVRVTLKDTGLCAGITVCTPAACCQSSSLEFQITVLPVNDCPEFQFRDVDVDTSNVVTTWGPAGGSPPGSGGTINTWEDTDFCQPAVVGVGYGGWNEGPSSLSPGPPEPWHDQVLVWRIDILDDSSMFKAAPHIRYVEGETEALLCFKPASDRSGVVRIKLHLEDTGGTVSGASGGGATPACYSPMVTGCYIRDPDEEITINIQEVNDPPTFNRGSAEVILLEDSGAYDRQWATNPLPGPPDEIANKQGLSHFEVDLLDPDHKALFTTLPALTLSGRLSFELRRNANTRGLIVRCAVRLMDLPQAPLAPIYSAKPDPVFTIVVEAVNDPPNYAPIPPKEVDVFEDTSGVISVPWVDLNTLCPGWDPIGVRCIANEGPQFTLTGVMYPGEGQTIGFAVIPQDASMFDGVLSIDPATGHLSFSLKKDANGATNVTVAAVDSGGVTPGDDTGPTTRFLLTVHPINDPPSFDMLTPRVTVAEDSGDFSEDFFLSSVTAGAPDESGQAITLSTRCSNEAIFSNPPRLTLNAQKTGATLSFTPKKDAFGEASVFFHLQDDGGTLSNGDDRTDGHELHITVTPVNDPPTASPGDTIVVKEDGGGANGVFSFPNWVRQASPGAMEEGVQFVQFDVECPAQPAAAMFAKAPEISPQGTLSFSAADDAFGSIVCDATVFDVPLPDGNRISQGNRFEFQIGIQRVNDPPQFSAGPSVAVPECRGRTSTAGSPEPSSMEVLGDGSCAYTFRGWASNITAGPPNEGYQKVGFAVRGVSPAAAADSLRVFRDPPAVDAAGTLSFTLKPGQFLEPPAGFTAAATDDGGVALGGSDTYESIFSIEITPDPSGGGSGGSPTTPVRMAVSQEPAVDGLSFTPATFVLLGRNSLPAIASESEWAFQLVDAGAGGAAGSAVFAESRRVVASASATFDGVRKGGAGRFVVTANATLLGGGVGGVRLTLSAASRPFLVEGSAGHAAATLMRAEGVPSEGGRVSEADIASGQVHVDVVLPTDSGSSPSMISGGGAAAWDPSVLLGATVAVGGAALQAEFQVLSASLLRIKLPPVDVNSTATLVVTLPEGSSTGAGVQLFTFEVVAAARVRAYLLGTATATTTAASTTPTATIPESALDGPGIAIAIDIIAGGEWSPDTATATSAAQACLQPHPDSPLGPLWHDMASATRTSSRRITLALRRNATAASATPLSDTDGFTLSAAALGDGIIPRGTPVWEGGTFVLGVTPRPDDGGGGGAEAWGYAAAAAAWVLVVAAAAGGISACAFTPAAQIAYITLAVTPAGGQPQLESRHQLQLLWKPFRLPVAGNEHTGAVLMLLTAAALTALLHAAAVRLASSRSDPHRAPTASRALLCFPSATLAVCALCTPMLCYNAVTLSAWAASGSPTDPPAGTAARAMSAAAVGVFLVACGVACIRAYRAGLATSWYSRMEDRAAGGLQEGGQGQDSPTTSKPGRVRPLGAVGEWVSAPEVRGVERYGSVFAWSAGRGVAGALLVVDTVCCAVLPGVAAVADPGAGGGGSLHEGRASALLCACVAGVRAAVLVAYRPHTNPIVGVADTAGAGMAAVSSCLLLVYLSEAEAAEPAVIRAATTPSWSAGGAAVCAMLAMWAGVVVSCVFLLSGSRRLLARLRGAKQSRDGPRYVGEPGGGQGGSSGGSSSEGCQGENFETNPIATAFPEAKGGDEREMWTR